MSRRISVVGIVLGTIGMSGCLGEFLGPGIKTSPRAMVTGVIVRPSQEIKSNYFHRLKVKFNIDQKPNEFDALLGYMPPLTEFQAEYRNPIPRFYLVSGWVYEAGECPSAETDLVDATAHGTNATMITQIDGTTHRVYLLRKSGTEQCTVTLIGVSPVVQIVWNSSSNLSHQYVEALPGAPPTLTGPFVVTGTKLDFLNNVVAYASEAAIIDAPAPP